jgi:hypothetical protein
MKGCIDDMETVRLLFGGNSRRNMIGVVMFLVPLTLVATGCRTPASGTVTPTSVARTEESSRTAVDWKKVEAAMGRSSMIQPGDVHRFNMPRTDLHVIVDGVELKPAFALGSWVAFKSVGEGTIAMGDLVLRDTEVAAVMSKLEESGIELTAVHHHLLRESPRLVYMHIHGHGDAEKIASGVRAALSLTGTPPASTAAASDINVGIDTAGISKAIGASGRMNGGVYLVSIPRPGKVRDGGIEIPASMGLATAVNLQPTGNGHAAVTGDFVMIASEVNPVLRSLRKNGIEVTSLHNHLLNDEPRLFFMHFWAQDDALKLAGKLRAALDLTASHR